MSEEKLKKIENTVWGRLNNKCLNEEGKTLEYLTILEKIYQIRKLMSNEKEFKEIEHFYHSNCGAFATDRPELIDKKLLDSIFWELT